MQTQDAMKQKFEAKIREANAELDRLAAKADAAKADARLELTSQLESARRKKSEFDAKFKELRETGADAASDVGKGLEKAWEDFAASLKSARDKIH